MNRIATVAGVGLLVVATVAFAQPACFDYGSLTQQTYRGSAPLYSRSVVVAGDIAYTTGVPETSLGIVTLGADSAPTLVAEIHPPWVRYLVVDGDRMFGGAEGTLTLFDRSDPLAPEVTGSLPTPLALEVRAVAMAGELGVALVDIGGVGAHLGVYDLEPFQLLGELALPTDVSDVVMAGPWVYLSGLNGSTLMVVDVSDPVAPVIATTVDIYDPQVTHIFDLELGDGRLFATTRLGSNLSRLHGFDLADPAAPVLEAAHDLPFDAAEAAWNGHALALRGRDDAANSPMLAGVEWSDPAAPQTIWETRGLPDGRGIAMHGEQVLTVHSGSLRVFAPGEVLAPAPTTVEAWYDLEGLTGVGDYVWVADTYANHGKIHVLDAAAGEFVAERSITNLGAELRPSPDEQLVLMSVGGAPWLLDAADPVDPTVIGPLPVADFAAADWDAARTLYLGTWHLDDPGSDPELLRLDLSDPAAPQVEGALTVPAPRSMVARDGWVYLGTEVSVVVVVDFRDPASPALAGEILVPGLYTEITDFELVGDRLLLATWPQNTVMTYDVSDPASPVLVQEDALVVSGRPELHRDGDTLYVFNPLGFQAFDLAGPLPASSGWYGHVQRVHDLCTSQGRIVMVSGDERLTMLPVQCAEVAAAQELPTAASTLSAWPNPFNPRVQLAGEVPASGRVRLTIHDLAGRRVATLADGPAAPGPASWTWYGADDAGRSLPSGVYLARFVTATGAVTTKLTLVR